nr:MAG TPA: replisome organizer [Caudoviricetes sp.]
MANKRMFNIKIVDSDAFLDMPLSAQCLYFHLSMRADDDGFVGNPKRIQRLVGASEDDLKLLIAKRFLLTFENRVIVIKHWRMHNTLSKSRYHETVYTDEKRLLKLKDNNSYSFNSGISIDDSKLIEMFEDNKRRTNGEQAENADIDIGLDIDKDIDKDISNIACTDKSEQAVIYIPLNDNSEYPIYFEFVQEMQSLYPNVDVMAELRKMRGWSLSNPTKRKTKRGVKKFINNWLAKEQDKGNYTTQVKQSKQSNNPYLDWLKQMEAEENDG